MNVIFVIGKYCVLHTCITDEYILGGGALNLTDKEIDFS